jgi:hypothetical protein
LQPSVEEVRSLHVATTELLSTRIARENGSDAPLEGNIYWEESTDG